MLIARIDNGKADADETKAWFRGSLVIQLHRPAWGLSGPRKIFIMELNTGR